MKYLTLLILSLCVSPLFAEPHRLVTSDATVKTYVVNMKTYKIVRSFDGILRDYWPDLDMVLTETGYTVYYVNGEETLTPEWKPGDGWLDHNSRTDFTLWNRSTGEMIRNVTGDYYTSTLWIHERKALLRNDRKNTTDIVDLVTGETLGTMKKFCWNMEEANAFLRSEPYVEPRDPHSCPDGTKWVEFQEVSAPGEKPGKWEVVMRSIATREKIWSVPFNKNGDYSLYSLRVSEDGKLVIADCYPPDIYDHLERTYVWNTQTGKKIAELYPLEKYFGKMNRLFGEGKDTSDVLLDAGTGKKIAEILGRYAAATDDERHFVTYWGRTLFLWDTETGERLGEFEVEDEINRETSAKFEDDDTRIRVIMPTPKMDTRFAAETVVFDVESGEVVLRENTFSDKARSGDIVWKTDKKNAVFWKTETDEPFFTIRVTNKGDSNRSYKIFGEIFCSEAGDAVIFSPKMMYLEDE